MEDNEVIVGIQNSDQDKTKYLIITCELGFFFFFNLIWNCIDLKLLVKLWDFESSVTWTGLYL